MLDRLIGGPPIVVDGRTLNRQVQAMIVAGEKLGLTSTVTDVKSRRIQLDRASALGMPKRSGIHVVDRQAPGPAGTIPVRIYRRFGSEPTPPAIVYLHGGGWAAGSLDSHEGSCRLLAHVTGCVVISVDYRLAPEHPFPAAVDDAIAAYRWVHSEFDSLGVAPGRVGVMGDSAGGNLAAVIAQVTRDSDVPPPVAQCLVYPATDMGFSTPSHQLFAEGFFLTHDDMTWFRDQYLPDPADRDSPLVSPLLTTDFSGLAPAVIVTAGFDPLRDEGKLYADALSEAGVDVRYRCYDDMVHGFFGMGILRDGTEMATEVCSAMSDLMWR